MGPCAVEVASKTFLEGVLMGLPRNIPVINSLAAAAKRTNILAGIPQRVVDEASRIDIALSREVADITYEVDIGDQIAIPSGSPCNINTTNGTLPRFDQDGVGSFMADAGQEIAIFGSNTNAAAKEIRAQVRITALEDLGLLPTSL